MPRNRKYEKKMNSLLRDLSVARKNTDIMCNLYIGENTEKEKLENTVKEYENFLAFQE